MDGTEEAAQHLTHDTIGATENTRNNREHTRTTQETQDSKKTHRAQYRGRRKQAAAPEKQSDTKDGSRRTCSNASQTARTSKSTLDVENIF